MSLPKWEGPVIVYRVRVEKGLYQEVQLRDPEAFAAALPSPFDGHSMKVDGPIPCTIDDRSKPEADFSYLLPGTVVFRQNEGGDNFTGLFSDELIPLDVDGELRYAMNVTNVNNSLDVSRSKIRVQEEGACEIERYAFFGHRLGSRPIFKIMQTRRVEILCYSGFNNSEGDEFPHYYRRRHLTGLKLEPIWTLPDVP